jgi:hypothetical protein
MLPRAFIFEAVRRWTLDQNKHVLLASAADEVATRTGLDADTAQKVIIEAYNIGDLELFIRRPTHLADGSFNFERLPPNAIDFAEWNPQGVRRALFEHSVIEAALWTRRPRGTMRRVAPAESRKIFVSRDSLDTFIRASSGPTTAGAEHRAIERLAKLLRAEPNMTKAAAQKACGSDVSKLGFKTRVWPRAREVAGLSPKAPAGQKRRIG